MEKNEKQTQQKNTQEDSDEMMIKIQTIDSICQITVKRNSTVSELKEKIVEVLNVPIPKQRLIFQGKWLQNNNEKLKFYKITDENVVHLVAKTNDDSEQNLTNQNHQSPDDTFNGLIEIPIIRSNRRNRRRRSKKSFYH